MWFSVTTICCSQWPEYLKGHIDYLWMDVATVHCCQRPQHLRKSDYRLTGNSIKTVAPRIRFSSQIMIQKIIFSYNKLIVIIHHSYWSKIYINWNRYDEKIIKILLRIYMTLKKLAHFVYWSRINYSKLTNSLNGQWADQFVNWSIILTNF